MIDSIEQIKSEVLSCTKCLELVKSRKRIAFSYGDGSSKVMIIGEAPSQVGGNLTGIPFSSAVSGNMIVGALQSAGLVREQCYITNILFCSPPNNRSPRPDEIANCIAYKKREIDVVNPKLIILLGYVSRTIILGTDSKPFAKYNRSGRIIATFPHPAWVSRQNDKELEQNYITKLTNILREVRECQPKMF